MMISSSRSNFFPSARHVLVLLLFPALLHADQRTILQLRDYTEIEVKGAGFTLPDEMPVHITALGGGSSSLPFSDEGMYAYAWIINADTRELVWKMTYDNTQKEKDDRKFDADVTLRQGSYEVYFTAYGFASSSGISNFNFNIDRRKETVPKDKTNGFMQWLQEIFGSGPPKDWKPRAKKWGVDLAVSSTAPVIPTFTPPKPFPHVLFQAVRLGENEHIQQRFTITHPVSLRIYALGERNYSQSLADYGWIIDMKTHKRIWEMENAALHSAGGATKNVKFDDVVQFPAGDFILYYSTDDSHSYVDWNAPPPNDPMNYGVSLIALNSSDKDNFNLSSAQAEEKNIIAQIVRVGNNEMRSETFSLKEDANVRVYALGERENSRRQMADFGWIIDARTREKVWTMDPDRTDHAGGASKNRMIDEVIPLRKGTYTVFYQSDDSHGYNSWNDSPPFDTEHWGITLYGEGSNFSMSTVEKNAPLPQQNIIAQITRVGNNANETRSFSLDKPTHVRIYAIGEGQNKSMYDYGWIENPNNGSILWEMTYEMTFHAGGGRKNRMVNTTILLDKGSYVLHYVSDDSHSFANWNVDPPDDPTMWGITLYKEEH